MGDDPNQAFEDIKTAIVDLLDAAKRKSFDRIVENKISPMFKGKILFIYFPNEYLSIYSDTYLAFFADCLNIPTESNKAIVLQQVLMDYQNGCTSLDGASVYAWPALLYDLFEGPKDDNAEPSGAKRNH